MIVPAKWHPIPLPKGSHQPNLPPKGSPLWEVSNVLYGGWHIHGCSLAKSFLASSSMVVPWWLPSVESPRVEATMQGFPKVILSNEAIAVLPGITAVASRFSIPMEVVTVSIHGLSPPTWLEGVREAGSSPGVMVGMIWLSAIAGLAAQGFIRSLGVPLSLWVTGTATFFLGRTSAAAGGLVSVDKVAGLAGMVLSVHWVVMGWGSTPSILAVAGRVMASSGEASVF